jgi:glutamine amidotransferase
MENLSRSGLREPLERRVIGDQVPLLGICLGLQLLTARSEEGNCDGLGWIAGETVGFDRGRLGDLRVPHIGWNTISIRRENPLLIDSVDGASFYFTHSYHLAGCPEGDVLATAEYGIEFPVAIGSGNIWGTQFHPEKSHVRGLAVLERFLEI